MESGQDEIRDALARCPECGAEIAPRNVSTTESFSIASVAGTSAGSQVAATTSSPVEQAPEHSVTSATHPARAGTRDEAAIVERWKIADERDQIAESRDRVADKRDEIAESRDRVANGDARAAYDRAMAATDRDRAARDREKAAALRIAAAHDRAEAVRERNLAGIDELTGVRLRNIGLKEVEREIERSRRTGAPLVLAFVDVNNLKAVNDEKGHLAGDVVLRRVAEALRTKLRPYDVIVRFGGDEFICALANIRAEAALERFTDIIATLERNGLLRPISFGLAEIAEADDLELLIKRADEALIESRRLSGHRRAS